jgi:putative transposase
MPNRPPRLPDFSYTGPHRYFLTVCTRSRVPHFADATTGSLVVQQFLRVASQQHFEIIAYCVMPDHFHALVQGTQENCNFHAMVRRWKQATGYEWKRAGHADALWQDGFFDRILRERDATEAVVRYIVSNPLRAGLVADIRDYELIGSGAYDLDALLTSSLDWSPRDGRRV